MSSAQIPQANLPTTRHEFGIVKQGEHIDHTFTVRNAGAATLTLQLLELTQPGMTARFRPEIPPGAEGTIRIQWDTSRVKGPVEGAAVVRTNDPRQPEAQFALKGEVQPPIELRPFGAVFLSAFRGETIRGSIQVLNHEDRPLSILGLESKSERFVASVHTVEAGKSYELRVTTRPGAPLGRTQEALYLITDDPMHNRLRVLVNVLIKSDVYVNPEAVDFGQVNLAEISSSPKLLDMLAQTFLVKTRQGEMSLTSVGSDLDFLKLRRSPQDGKSATFRIDVALDQSKLRPGLISGSIHLTTSDPRFPELTVPVRGEIQ